MNDNTQYYGKDFTATSYLCIQLFVVCLQCNIGEDEQQLHLLGHLPMPQAKGKLTDGDW